MLNDSGCNKKSTLPRSLADDRGYHLQATTPSAMTWANGESEILDESTIVGPIEFLVSEQVTQPLLATNDLVNANNKVVFDSERSFIEDKSTGLQTDMQRTDGLWTINIDTLERFFRDG